MDSFLITLVVIVIAALSNWLQHRAQAQNEQMGRPEPSPPLPDPRAPRTGPQPASPRPSIETTLERELRRLLGEEPPVALPAPRPVQTEPPRRPPVVVPKPAAPRQHAGPFPASPSPLPIPTPSLAQLSQSTSAFGRAHQLHESVALQLHQVDEQTEKHGLNRLRLKSQPVAPHVSAIFDLRRNRQAARQAFVASLVFGVPKSLGD